MNHRKILTALGLAALVVFAATSCKRGAGSESEENSRLKSVPEQNVVEVVELKLSDFQRQLLSNGKLSASKKTSLKFKESGIITEIRVNNGERVSEGAVIARIEDSEARIALEAAAVEMEKARLEYVDVLVGLGYQASDTASVPADIKTLAGIRSGFNSAQINYKKASAALEATTLKAPFAGKVADISLSRWDNSGSDPFCSVVDDSCFDVDFYAIESEYSFLSKGQTVRVALFTDLENFIPGKITTINPSVDKNGQIAVRAQIKGNGRMIDGMNVKVIVEKTDGHKLVVPKSAVVVRDNLDVLFRYNNGRAEWVYVNVLDSNSESFVVEANKTRGAVLNVGDSVIVSGNLNLAEGSKVTLKK